MPRIFQTLVPALLPKTGEVRVMLYGEAPGPRGADQSGIPFWGDRAGLPVYRALEAAGLAQVPPSAYEEWDGARFRELGLAPALQGAGLGNAYPRCPTRDGEHFHAPSDKQLCEPLNLERLRGELAQAASRCPGTLRVITLGKRAAWIMERLEQAPPFQLHPLPHPSAQGLLQAAPNKGKGMRLQDLQRAWEESLGLLLK